MAAAGHFVEARQVFEEAARLAPTDGSLAAAIADADKAASVAPALLNLHYNKGQALEQMGRTKEAAAEYRILLQKSGPDDHAFATLARERLAAIEKSPENRADISSPPH